MNALRGRCCRFLALTIAAAACTTNRTQDMEGERERGRDQPQYFATQEEVVAKARQDLLEVLRLRSDLNLGVDAATLGQSQPAPAVRRVDVAFDRLLRAESTDSFGALVQSDRTIVVPLVTGGRVATIVEVVRDPRGWRVAGLAGRDIAADLTAVRAASGGSAPVTLYEIPNLQARVYGVGTGSAERLFTDYRGRFSIREAVSADMLIPALRVDAIDFQSRYGDSLRVRRLVR